MSAKKTQVTTLEFPDNKLARDFVRHLRSEHRDIMDRHGAVHTQLARFYAFPDAMDIGSRELLKRLKKSLDPGEHLNPGVLGI